MPPNFTLYLNKMIFVSIPGMFGGAEARRCQLAAVEPSGLWLVSEDLVRAVQPDAKREKTEVLPAIFVPFAQIAAVLPAAAPSVAEGVGLKPATAAPATSGAQPIASKPAQ